MKIPALVWVGGTVLLTLLPVSLGQNTPIEITTAIDGASSSSPPNDDGANVNQSSCQLVALLDFHYLGLPLTNRLDPSARNGTSVAASHLVAAELAVEHFNDRNPVVVPELLELTANCSVVLPPLLVRDTDDQTTTVAAAVLEVVTHTNNTNICGIVGPYSNDATMEAGVLAKALVVPHIGNGADNTLISNDLSAFVPTPYSFLTTVNQHAVGEALVNFLRYKNRTNFLAVIHDTSAYGTQGELGVDNAAKEALPFTFSHIHHSKIAPPFSGYEPNRGIGYALREVKKTTFRTIVVIINSITALDTLQLLADYAQEFQMNGDDYVWMFMTPSETLISHFVDYKGGNNANVTKLLNGAAVIKFLDGFNKDPQQDDAFETEFKKRQQKMMVEENDQHGIIPEPKPQPGSSYMYDAVMLAALSSCRAEHNQKKMEAAKNRQRRVKGVKSPQEERQLQKKKKKAKPLPPKVQAVTEVQFTGATGKIEFTERCRRNRHRDTMSFGVYNLAPMRTENDGDSLWYYLTDILEGFVVTGDWTETPEGPFLFASGLASAPELLHDPPPQNYLSTTARVFGLAMMGLSLLLSAMTLGYIAYHRNARIIKRYQPEFLYLLLVGTLIMTSSIVTISFDEGVVGWSEDMLDGACMAFPWLVSTGYIVIQSAFFMKLWRIDRVLQAKRRAIKASQVTGPSIVMVLTNSVVLVVWTILDPYHWKRTIIDEESLESYGKCESEHALVFWGCLGSLMGISTAMSFVTAWKTKDVDENYSEARWIFYTIALQVQVLVVAVPLLVALENASADATYLGRMLLIWSIPMTSTLLIFGPKVKMLAFPGMGSSTKTRGATGRTQVSGLDANARYPVQNRTASLEDPSTNLGQETPSALSAPSEYSNRPSYSVSFR